MSEVQTDGFEHCTTIAETLAGYWDINTGWSAEHDAAFRQSFADTSAGVFRVRPGGFIHDCNERAAEILGYTPNELRGTPLASMHPRSERGSRRAAQLFAKFHAGERFCGEPLDMNHRDGRVLTVSLCSIPLLGTDGEVHEGISIIQLMPDSPAVNC